MEYLYAKLGYFRFSLLIEQKFNIAQKALMML